MEVFFKRLSNAMSEAGLLRFGRLRLGEKTVASIMCFDYNGIRYLYNSGYDPEYSSLSVGLLSKVYSVKDAIEQKMTQYDFLKGAEIYKYHLGGREMPISRVRIELPE
jgi:CelD/BcsL family acetyltransferase involved in cellulose biosynthesis